MPTLFELYGIETPSAPAQPKQSGQFMPGLKRSFAELPGLAAGVGAYAADVVGADGARDSMLAYAKQKNDEVAQAHQGDASSITDAWDGKVGWLDFLKNSAGYVAGQAMQSIATGGLGAVGAKMLARQGAKEIAEAAAAKAIAGGASEEVAKQASIKALSEASTKAMEIGGVLGAGAHNFGMELGSIYPDAVETAGGADKLDAGDKFRVFAAASLAAGVDTAGEAILASRVLKGSKAEGAGVLGRAAREVPAGMLREGGTEAVQTAIEHYGAGQPIADDKGLRDIIDSAGVGMVGGGLGGGAASLRARQRAELDAQAHQQLATATNVGDMISAANAIASTPLDLPDTGARSQPAAVPPEGSAGTVDQTPAQRVDALRAQLQDPQVREQIREKLGPDAMGTLGYYATQATRGDIPAATAERMLGLAEMIVSRAVLQPIDTSAGSAQQQAIGARSQDLLGMEQGPALIGADTRPTGTMRVDSAGVAIPETGIDRVNARQSSQQADDAQAAAAAEAASLGAQARKASAVNADPNPRRPAPPLLMPERRRTDAVELQPVEPTDPVAAYLERVSAVNTPQARAFVQDFKAGRITRHDVIRVMQSQDADPLTPAQRIEQAAAQAPKPAGGVQPAQVYRSRSAAFVESRKTGGTVEPVQGGFIVKEPSNVEPDVAGTAGLPPAASDGRAPDTGRSVGDLGPQSVGDGRRVDEPSAAPVVSGRAADAARDGDQRDAALTGHDSAPQSVVDAAANEAATSPTNDRPEPTQAQKEAGNYAKGHVRVAGLDITVENPQGSTRSGVDTDGNAWTNTLQHHYGYVKRSTGADGEQVDVFVKPGTSADHSGPVYVVDQIDPSTGKFDEHKALIGFDSEQEARDAYAANYAKGWKGLKAVTSMSADEFNEWVNNPASTKRPAAKEQSSSPRPEALIELRKRESILKSLKECLG